MTRLFIECEWTMVSNNNVWALWFGDLSTSEPQSQSQFKPQLQCSQRFSCLESWFYSCRLISDFICGATASFQSRVNRLFWTRFWLVWPGKFFIRDCICKLAKKNMWSDIRWYELRKPNLYVLCRFLINMPTLWTSGYFSFEQLWVSNKNVNQRNTRSTPTENCAMIKMRDVWCKVSPTLTLPATQPESLPFNDKYVFSDLWGNG